MERVW